MNDQWAERFYFKEPGVVLSAAVGVAGFLPIHEVQRILFRGQPVPRLINREGIDRLAICALLRPEALRVDLGLSARGCETLDSFPVGDDSDDGTAVGLGLVVDECKAVKG